MLGRDCVIINIDDAAALYDFLFLKHAGPHPIKFYEGMSEGAIKAWDAIREASRVDQGN